ncbi:TetR/AcrR family transcriptional regulator [Algoriphagus vanfongensis]|uniref:TetR/AcrR family transcriptional regulator n=1 Tax=Algoriphagus vanfongensis TaxID=426371 RepID=UPI00041EB776|nr:TetR/AcrR family transcriptional regulator [Algoriphagus vanfongensis]
METRDKILNLALEQFTKYGVRSTTMDDIARLMGISKKTLYQEFRDKRELIHSTFSLLLDVEKQELSEILRADLDAIDHLVEVSKMIRHRLQTINPLTILEIQKYFPESWTLFEEFRDRVILVNLERIIEEGKQNGYFRTEVDTGIMARMRVNQISSAMDPAKVANPDYDLVEEQLQTMDHFLHGIFTEKGREAYRLQKTK